MRVAAFQNGYFIALCNRVGRDGALEFAGESFVCSPEGFVLARAPSGEEHVLIADWSFKPPQDVMRDGCFCGIDGRIFTGGGWVRSEGD